MAVEKRHGSLVAPVFWMSLERSGEPRMHPIAAAQAGAAGGGLWQKSLVVGCHAISSPALIVAGVLLVWHLTGVAGIEPCRASCEAPVERQPMTPARLDRGNRYV